MHGAALVLTLAPVAMATPITSFYTIAAISSSTAGSDLYTAQNLIKGQGVGFDAATGNQLDNSDFAASRWVTTNPGGFPSNYFNYCSAPVLRLDLGQNRLLSEIGIWGYNAANANSASHFKLRFASAADGVAGFGSSIDFGSNYFLAIDDLHRQSFGFGRAVNARYVEFTADRNFCSNGGNGPPVGGDRVGLGEIAFQSTVPEPASLALTGLALLALPVSSGRRRFGQRG